MRLREEEARHLPIGYRVALSALKAAEIAGCSSQTSIDHLVRCAAPVPSHCWARCRTSTTLAPTGDPAFMPPVPSPRSGNDTEAQVQRIDDLHRTGDNGGAASRRPLERTGANESGLRRCLALGAGMSCSAATTTCGPFSASTASRNAMTLVRDPVGMAHNQCNFSALRLKIANFLR